MVNKRLKKIFVMYFSMFMLSMFFLSNVALAFTPTNEINADAIYRKKVKSSVDFNHAGIYVYVNNRHRAYEMPGPDCSVERNSMDNFIDNKTYYGAYYQPSVNTNSERNDIINTCQDLADNNEIAYTWSDCLSPEFTPGSQIDPEEVWFIRCDGVVEYAYEYNGFKVWGKANPPNSSGSPTHFDISDPDYYEEHNDLGYNQPWKELSPRVQRGAEGSKWTKLKER